MNQKLIKQLQNGEIAVKNDGTLQELREVLKVAFPLDWGVNIVKGLTTVYNANPYSYNYYGAENPENLPEYSVKDFFKTDELTLEEMIEAVKLKAKIAGYKCDVVLGERKEVEVEFLNSNGKSNYYADQMDYNFSFSIKNMKPCNLHDVGEHLAKCLKEYLENN